nr:hypothetical protein [uncultured bacterium]
MASALAPFAGVLSWEWAVIVVSLADHLDGILSGGGFGRSPEWSRYRKLEYWSDLFSFMPLAIYPLCARMLKEIWPCLIPLAVLFPIFAVKRRAFKADWTQVFKPGSFEFLLPVAIASLAGFDPTLPAIFGMTVSPLVQCWVHSPDWRLRTEQVALAGFFASSLWLGIASVLMREWHTALAAVPILTLFVALERRA